MNAQNVGLSEHIFKVGNVFAPGRGGGDLVAGVVEDAHGEGVGKLSETGSDPAESENGKGTSCEVVRVGRDRGWFPRTGAQGTFTKRELADGCEDEVESCSCGCVVDGAWGIGHADAYRADVSLPQ